MSAPSLQREATAGAVLAVCAIGGLLLTIAMAVIR